MAQILDQFGREIETSPAALGLETRSIVASAQDRASVGSVLGNVTPRSILSAFAEADNGFPGRQIELAQDIRERDDHVASLDQTRRLAVMGMEFIIEPGDDSDAAQIAADEWSTVWEALDPRTIIDRMMDAVLEQWSVQRVIWDTTGETPVPQESPSPPATPNGYAVASGPSLGGRGVRWTPVAVEEVDARRLAWPQTASGEAGDISSIVPGVMLDWNSANIETLTPGKYLWHSYRARSGRPGKGALIRCLAVYWMFKRFSLNDMASLLEQWGRPWPSVSYDEKATTAEVSVWLDRMVASMSSRVIALPKGAELKVNDASASGADTPHINMIKACNEAISKALIGSTTIAEAAGNNDSVSSPTHAQVREDIRNADALSVAASIRRNLIVPWCVWNYGPTVAAPTFSPNTASKVDPQARSQVYIAARDLGLKVNSEQMYRELKLERPDEVADVLDLKVAPPALPFGIPNEWASGRVGEGASGAGAAGSTPGPQDTNGNAGRMPAPQTGAAQGS